MRSQDCEARRYFGRGQGGELWRPVWLWHSRKMGGASQLFQGGATQSIVQGLQTVWSLSQPLSSAFPEKASIDNKEMNGCDSVPIKLSLHKETLGWLCLERGFTVPGVGLPLEFFPYVRQQIPLFS